MLWMNADTQEVATLSAKQPFHLHGRKPVGLVFLFVIDGLEIPSMVRNCWAQLASKQFLSCECANGDMKE